MKKYLFLLLFICTFVSKIFSAEPPENFSEQENRFLFVFENSSMMKRCAKAAQETVGELIASGVQGEMRAGDTYGIWTFDEQLNSTFPIQTWTPETSQSLALSAQDFLKKHLYKNKAQLSAALPKIYSLIKTSRSITVILISTGSEAVRGTPFDKEINAIFPQYSRELSDAKLPFVTVLIGYHGRPVAYSVNSSLTIHIPQPPLKTEKLEPKKTNIVATAKRETKPIAPVVAPTIPKVEIKPEIKKTTATDSTNVSSPVVEPPVATDKANTTDLSTPAKSEPFKSIDTPSLTPPIAINNSASVQSTPEKKTELKSGDVPLISNKPHGVVMAATEQQSPVRKSDTAPNTTEQSKPLPPVTPTPVVASQPTFTPKKLMIAGAGLMLVAGILILLLINHSRKSRPSLISRSISGKK